MELVGIVIAIFAGVLTFIAWRNGRWMKQAHSDTQDLIRGTQDLIKLTHSDTQDLIRGTRELIKEESRLTRELLERMDQRFNESLANINQSLANIGKLIVADGERTRELVRELKMRG